MQQIDPTKSTNTENNSASLPNPSRLDLLPRKSRIILSFLIVIALGLMVLPRPSLHYAQVIVEVPGGMRLDFLLNGKENHNSCYKSATAITHSIQSICPACKVSKLTCLTNLPQTLRQRFDDTPLPDPSGRMENGTVIYQAAQANTALLACLESERQAIRAGKSSRVACYPANSPRPHTSFEKENAESGHIFFTLLLAIMGGLISALVATILTAYYRLRGETPSMIENAAQTSTKPRSPWLDKLALAGVDCLILLGAFLAMSWPEGGNISQWSRFDRTTVIGHGGVVLITLCWFWLLLEHYSRRRPFWDELREILRVLSIMFMVTSAAAFAIGIEGTRESHMIVWALIFLLIPLGRAAMRNLLNDLGLWQRSAVIIGTGKNAQEAHLALLSERGMGYRIIAYVEPNHTQANRAHNNQASESGVGSEPTQAGQAPDCPILYTTPAEIEKTLNRLGNPQIIFALDSLASQSSQAILRKLTLHHKNIHLIPSIRGLPLFGTELSHFFSHEVLFLTLRNNLSRRGYRWLKRVFDLCAATILLILVSPLLAFVAWRIWREDGSPVIFRQARVAYGDGEFPFLKFRSMIKDADNVLERWKADNSPLWQEYVANNFKLANDPRVLSIGQWIRATSIDELPQLINVIRGEMSLVGPRPLLKRELDHYGELIQLYRQTPPGITGLWQISGRSSTTFIERVNLDAWYVKNWSLWYDIAILFKTISVVFCRKGAY